MQLKKIKSVIDLFLILSLLLNSISIILWFIIIYNSFGYEKAVESTRFIMIIIPLAYIYCLYKKFKLNYISILLLFTYFIYKFVGIQTLPSLFTMFFWKSFSLQPYLYRLSSWLIPLFSLIGVVIQIIEYRKLKDDGRTG